MLCYNYMIKYEKKYIGDFQDTIARIYNSLRGLSPVDDEYIWSRASYTSIFDKEAERNTGFFFAPIKAVAKAMSEQYCVGYGKLLYKEYVEKTDYIGNKGWIDPTNDVFCYSCNVILPRSYTYNSAIDYFKHLSPCLMHALQIEKYGAAGFCSEFIKDFIDLVDFWCSAFQNYSKMPKGYYLSHSFIDYVYKSDDKSDHDACICNLVIIVPISFYLHLISEGEKGIVRLRPYKKISNIDYVLKLYLKKLRQHYVYVKAGFTDILTSQAEYKIIKEDGIDTIFEIRLKGDSFFKASGAKTLVKILNCISSYYNERTKICTYKLKLRDNLVLLKDDITLYGTISNK